MILSIIEIDDERFRKRNHRHHLYGQPLSNREREVLRFIALGETNKAMAALLHISIKTVEKFRNSLMKKLDIHETATLTHYALAMGVVGNKFGGNHG